MADRAKLFTHGGSQAVRLPRAYRFKGKEVSIRQDGDAVILEPVAMTTKELFDQIDALMQGKADFPDVARLPAEDPDIEW